MIQATCALEVFRLRPELEIAFLEFLHVLSMDPDTRGFHPHAFDAATAAALTHYEGRDLYYVFALDGQVVAYGMLRGWDEGFDVPSLGLAVHPERRGMGLGGAMMAFLHAAARMRGARKIRLKVHPDNHGAVSLYERTGYQLGAVEDGQLVGYIDLS